MAHLFLKMKLSHYMATFLDQLQTRLIKQAAKASHLVEAFGLGQESAEAPESSAAGGSASDPLEPGFGQDLDHRDSRSNRDLVKFQYKIIILFLQSVFNWLQFSPQEIGNILTKYHDRL